MTKPRPHDPPVRVFFALWPDAGECAALAAWLPPLRKLCGGKAMRADTLHATLVFLGDVAAHRLEALKLAAEEVGGEPFELGFDSARYWGHNHIAYAAPSVMPAPLPQLVLDLEERLRAHRFPFDSRDYKPHVTLLRHAQWRDEPLPEMPEVAWRVRDFVLVQSLSDDQGARYEVLARFPLAGPRMI
ncbi:MAG TPA: RNA 2',3'-cyclic phosphodiesterase [Gallionella sp.]|nr:RNA 2',3'-cyclic phosphodiesterase [Gallionella sp.]